MAPSRAAPIILAHDRWLSSAAMEALADGRSMIVHDEADSSSGTWRLMARVFDPDAGVVVSSEVIEEAVAAYHVSSLHRMTDGTLVLGYSSSASARAQVRLFVAGHWTTALEVDGDQPALLGVAPDRTVVLATANVPLYPSAATLITWSPSRGWSKEPLSESLYSSLPPLFLLPDGRVVEFRLDDARVHYRLRLREAAGTWKNFDELLTSLPVEMLADGTLFVWDDVVPGGISGTRRLLSRTWRADEGYSAVETVSLAADGTEAVVPNFYRMPFTARARLDDRTIELAAWMGHCTTMVTECTFAPIARRFHDGRWSAPIDLSFGVPAPGANVAAYSDHGRILLARTAPHYEFRARLGDAYLAPAMLDDALAPYLQRWVLGAHGAWAIAGGDTRIPATIAWFDGDSIDRPATTSPLPFATFPRAAHGGGITFETSVDALGALFIEGHPQSATGVKPYLERVSAAAATPVTIGDDDERYPSWAFAAAAPGTASSFLTSNGAVGTTDTARLHAHAWNAAGDSAFVIADETRAPRMQGAIARGCGGAVLFLADARTLDGDRRYATLELALVR